MSARLAPTTAIALACALCMGPSILDAQSDTTRSRSVARRTRDAGSSRLRRGVGTRDLRQRPVRVHRCGQQGRTEGGCALDRDARRRTDRELAVEFISTTRASCKILSSTAQVAVGDSAPFQSGAPGLRAAEATLLLGSAPPPAPPRPPAPRTCNPSALRGRFGLRYLVFDAGVGGALLQPAIDLRLDGQHLGGSGFGIAVDARAQRAVSTSTAISADGANVTRVYQAALIFNPAGSPLQLSVGRQFATALPTVGLFDGASLDFNYSRWGFGAFGGDEPDIVTMGLSNATREYGTYVQLHSVRGRDAALVVHARRGRRVRRKPDRP